MELNQERIEAGVIAEVSDRLVDDKALSEMVRKSILEKIEIVWKMKSEAEISKACEAAIVAGFDHEYQRISSFGEPVGAKTTIRKELEKLVEGYWNETVDKNGKPSKGYGDKLTRAEWIMMQIVSKDFSDDLKQYVVNIGGSLKDNLRGELHEMVNRLLGEVFNVRSLGDQGAKRDSWSSKPSQN